MTKIPQARFHKIFPAELSGDTLIVRPQGDAAGFRQSDLPMELHTLLALVDEPQVDNLLIDFGRADYFGSVVIGAIHSLGVKVRNAGGRVGICDTSDEMLETLRILKLDAIWTKFDSVKAALKAFKG